MATSQAEIFCRRQCSRTSLQREKVRAAPLESLPESFELRCFSLGLLFWRCQSEARERGLRRTKAGQVPPHLERRRSGVFSEFSMLWGSSRHPPCLPLSPMSPCPGKAESAPQRSGSGWWLLLRSNGATVRGAASCSTTLQDDGPCLARNCSGRGHVWLGVCLPALDLMELPIPSSSWALV